MNRRRLPHLYVVGEALFVTFRLKDSLPVGRGFPNECISSGEAFAAMDRLLDEARGGPRFLGEAGVARVVLDSLWTGVRLGHFELHAWVIMPNHVHLLMTPRGEVSKVMGSLKATSAKQANLLLGRTGAAFWQDESYDRLVRNQDEFFRIQRYIEQNPVRAGLVRTAEEFFWSSPHFSQEPHGSVSARSWRPVEVGVRG